MGMVLRDRLGLFLLLIVFIACKVPHLWYPYYWDESGMFAPGVMAMYLHGASLLPNAIDVSFGRGHPLLYHAVCAQWMKLFGPSHFSLHCFSLLISIALIVMVFEAGLRLFTRRVAFISVLALSINTFFFVQSSFLTPDIFIALLSFSTLYFYVREKYFLSALLLTMLVYTKESGIVAVFILGIDALTGALRSDTPVKDRLAKVASVLVPLIVGLSFYVTQKIMMGWYTYPGAFSSHPNFDPGSSIYWLKTILGVLLVDEHRYFLSLLLIFLSLAAAIAQGNVKFASLALPGIFLYALTHGHIAHTEFLNILFLTLFLGSTALSIFFLGRMRYYTTGQQKKFINLLSIFTLFYVYYFSVYNFQWRYIFAAMVALYFVFAVFADFYISRLFPAVYYLVLAGIGCAGIYCFTHEAGDSDLGFFDGMKLQQEVVNYFEQNELYNNSISVSSDFEEVHLRDPYTGFLHTDRNFSNVRSGAYNSQADYVVFSSIEYDSTDYARFKKDTTFQLILSLQEGIKWAEIYKKKQGTFENEGATPYEIPDTAAKSPSAQRR